MTFTVKFCHCKVYEFSALTKNGNVQNNCQMRIFFSPYIWLKIPSIIFEKFVSFIKKIRNSRLATSTVCKCYWQNEMRDAQHIYVQLESSHNTFNGAGMIKHVLPVVSSRRKYTSLVIIILIDVLTKGPMSRVIFYKKKDLLYSWGVNSNIGTVQLVC